MSQVSSHDKLRRYLTLFLPVHICQSDHHLPNRNRAVLRIKASGNRLPRNPPMFVEACRSWTQEKFLQLQRVLCDYNNPSPCCKESDCILVSCRPQTFCSGCYKGECDAFLLRNFVYDWHDSFLFGPERNVMPWWYLFSVPHQIDSGFDVIFLPYRAISSGKTAYLQQTWKLSNSLQHSWILILEIVVINSQQHVLN